jgi:hypothetical protein
MRYRYRYFVDRSFENGNFIQNVWAYSNTGILMSYLNHHDGSLSRTSIKIVLIFYPKNLWHTLAQGNCLNRVQVPVVQRKHQQLPPGAARTPSGFISTRGYEGSLHDCMRITATENSNCSRQTSRPGRITSEPTHGRTSPKSSIG